ncbi:MAG: hypothetical protein GY930_00130 [bacterium]|nr:hypothetical protein [bacterium]
MGSIPPPHTMEKRNYKRRSSTEIVEDLQARIQALEVRIEAKKRKDMPIFKELTKVRKTLGNFSQTCVDNGRSDLSNSVLAFISTLDRQSQAPTENVRY